MACLQLITIIQLTKAMPADEQETYIKRLGELGYVWQFITLAGLHTTALAVDDFANNYAKIGMRAYGSQVQEPEIAKGVEVVKHQNGLVPATLTVC